MKKVILCPNPYRDSELRVCKEAKKLLDALHFQTAHDRLHGHGPNLSPARLLPQRIQMTSTNNTYDDVTMVVADLDGTLLHDGKTFEDRFLTQRSIDSINRMHDAGIKFVVETARPVSTGYSFVQKLPVDAVAYLNGALLDFNPVSSDYDMLTSPTLPKDGHLQKIGFSSKRACEVCKYLLEELPGMEVGIVMDDVRYTNFDVTKYWKTQTWRYTDFDDVPDLPAADLLGVGRATQRVLDSYCIRTIGDLAKTDPDFLNRRLGKNGIALWQYANGNDRSRVMNADFVSPVKSVGHGITTIEDLENDEQVWPVFLELTQDIGHKLRVHKKCADGVAIHIRDNTLFSKQWQTALDMPTQSPMLIAKAAFALFEKRYDWRNPIRSVTIQAINLVPQDTPRQVDLFMNIEKIEKAERLDQCIETIRQRFGKNSIRNGILFQNLRMPSEKPEITMPTGVLC